MLLLSLNIAHPIRNILLVSYYYGLCQEDPQQSPNAKHKAGSMNFAGTVQLSAPVRMYGTRTRTRNSC